MCPHVLPKVLEALTWPASGLRVFASLAVTSSQQVLSQPYLELAGVDVRAGRIFVEWHAARCHTARAASADVPRRAHDPNAPHADITQIVH